MYLVLALFFLQGLFFAAAIKYKIPPDEKTHFLFTQYYSHQSILSGPFISHQHGSFVLGDIQRTTSYLYQYLLSFPLRVVQHLSSDMQVQVFAMRLFSVALGLCSLLILAKLFDRLKITPLMRNLILLALSLSGMYVWIFAAVNYDVLAIPLFFLMLLFLLDFIKERSFIDLMLSTFTALALALTKFTYVPFILLAFVIILLWNKHDMKGLFNDVRSSINFDKHKVLLTGLIIINLLFVGLVIERYGYNLVKYHSFTPSCTKIHELSECLQTPNFSRNTQQAEVFKQFKAQGGQLLGPIEFTGQWVEQMYERIYFYFGHKYIIANSIAKDFAALLLAAVIILFIFRPIKILTSKEKTFIAYITIAYVLVLFFFNLHSYLSTGAEFGFQGRYLLPVLPFLYLFVFLAARNFYARYLVGRKIALWGVGIILLANLYVHMPVLVFMRGTDNVWYTSRTAKFDNKVKNGLAKTKLLHWTLPYGQ